MQFLSFPRYTELGGKIKNENIFNRAETIARMAINANTQNRLLDKDTDDPIWKDVEFLVMELIERGYLGDLNGMDVSSESAGKMSASYVTKDGKAEALIAMFLPSLVSTGGITQVKVLRT